MQEAGDKMGFCGGQVCPWIHLELQILPLLLRVCVVLSVPELSIFGSRLRKKETEKRQKRILVVVACYCGALVLVQMEALVAF